MKIKSYWKRLKQHFTRDPERMRYLYEKYLEEMMEDYSFINEFRKPKFYAYKGKMYGDRRFSVKENSSFLDRKDYNPLFSLEVRSGDETSNSGF